MTGNIFINSGKNENSIFEEIEAAKKAAFELEHYLKLTTDVARITYIKHSIEQIHTHGHLYLSTLLGTSHMVARFYVDDFEPTGNSVDDYTAQLAGMSGGEDCLFDCFGLLALASSDSDTIIALKTQIVDADTLSDHCEALIEEDSYTAINAKIQALTAWHR